jgi:hypothetical protein
VRPVAKTCRRECTGSAVRSADSNSCKDSGKAPRAIPGEELPGGSAGGEAEKEIPMYLSSPLTAFVVLFVAWVFGFFVFHFAGGLIHLLLAVAAVSLVVHFVRGRP